MILEESVVMAILAHFPGKIKYLSVGFAKDDERVQSHIDLQLIVKASVNKLIFFLDEGGGKLLGTACSVLTIP